MKTVNCVTCNAGVNVEVAVNGQCKVCQVKASVQKPVAPVVKVEYAVCATEVCSAKLHPKYVEDKGNKCPKCTGVSYTRPVKTRKGMTACGCGAQIPNSMVEAWGGKCPKCQGGKQESVKKKSTQQFSKKEEFEAATNKVVQATYKVVLDGVEFDVPNQIDLEVLKYNIKNLNENATKEKIVTELVRVDEKIKSGEYEEREVYVEFKKSWKKKQLIVAAIINRAFFLLAPQQ